MLKCWNAKLYHYMRHWNTTVRLIHPCIHKHTRRKTLAFFDISGKETFDPVWNTAYYVIGMWDTQTNET